MSFLSDILGDIPIIGPLIQGASSLGAGGIQANAGNKAIDTQREMFNEVRANLAPWMTQGQNANTALSGYLGVGPGGTFNPNAPGVAPFTPATYMASPGYNWLRDQTLSAALNKRSSLGGVLSGGTLKDLAGYGEGLAAQDYNNAFNRYITQQQATARQLLGLSSLGENAAAGVGNAGITTGQGIAQTQASQGNVLASGLIGAGNAATGGINNALLMQAIQQAIAGGGGSASGALPPGLGTGTLNSPNDLGVFDPFAGP